MNNANASDYDTTKEHEPHKEGKNPPPQQRAKTEMALKGTKHTTHTHTHTHCNYLPSPPPPHMASPHFSQITYFYETPLPPTLFF